jgi:hypothetical protein
VVDPSDQQAEREFEYYDDINYRSYFTRISYIFNAEKFSLKAARNYSYCRQRVPVVLWQRYLPFFSDLL